MAAPIPLPGERSVDHPRTWAETAGYVVAHPKTWILVVALAVAWRCYGLGDAVKSFSIPSAAALETSFAIPTSTGATP